MKRIIIIVTLLISLLAGVAATGPQAQAQEASEDLDTILARTAAKSFLVTLTRPELAATRDFYLADGLQIDGILADLGEINGFEVNQATWLTPGQVYQTEANLRPGSQTIRVTTVKQNNRWKVEGIELNTPADNGNGAAATTTTTAQAGPAPVAGNGSGQLVFQTSSGGDIYLINADGIGLRRVTHGLDPQLSPDGNQIVFTRWSPRYELFTINTDGSNERSWFGGKRQMKSPTWSADGNTLTFSFQEGGRLEGDKKRISLSELAKRQALGEQIDRVPDNARGVKIEDGALEYFIPPDAHWWLAEIDLANQTYSDVSTGSKYNYAPVGHPTNPDLLYYRADKGIGEYNAAAQNSRPVSTDDRDRGAISVSPDGSRMAFTYNQDGHWEIHTINMDGSNRRRLPKTPLHVVAGQTTADNSAYTNEEGFRTMSRAQGGSMPNLNWNNAAPVWSPDGSQIAFVTDRTGQWEIWIMNADGSNQRPMFSNGALDGIELTYNGVDERMLSWR